MPHGHATMCPAIGCPVGCIYLPGFSNQTLVEPRVRICNVHNVRHNVSGHRPPWTMFASTMQCLATDTSTFHQSRSTILQCTSMDLCHSLSHQDAGPSMGSVLVPTAMCPPVDITSCWANGCCISTYVLLPGSPCITLPLYVPIPFSHVIHR